MLLLIGGSTTSDERSSGCGMYFPQAAFANEFFSVCKFYLIISIHIAVIPFKKVFQLNLKSVFLKRIFKIVAMNTDFVSSSQDYLPLVQVVTFETTLKLN